MCSGRPVCSLMVGNCEWATRGCCHRIGCVCLARSGCVLDSLCVGVRGSQRMFARLAVRGSQRMCVEVRPCISVTLVHGLASLSLCGVVVVLGLCWAPSVHDAVKAVEDRLLRELQSSQDAAESQRRADVVAARTATASEVRCSGAMRRICCTATRCSRTISCCFSVAAALAWPPPSMNGVCKRKRASFCPGSQQQRLPLQRCVSHVCVFCVCVFLWGSARGLATEFRFRAADVCCVPLISPVGV